MWVFLESGELGISFGGTLGEESTTIVNDCTVRQISEVCSGSIIEHRRGLTVNALKSIAAVYKDDAVNMTYYCCRNSYIILMVRCYSIMSTSSYIVSTSSYMTDIDTVMLQMTV